MAAESSTAAPSSTRSSAPRLNVTISPLVPKPHTPCQWQPMAPLQSVRDKMQLIRQASRSRRVRYKFHSPERSLVEAVLARGDRRLGRALLKVRQADGQFDAWDEGFRFDLWVDALQGCGISLDAGSETGGEDAASSAVQDANSPFRVRRQDEFLPWDHIDCGVSKEFLLAERERGFRGEKTPDCRQGPCSLCGACERADS